MTRKAATRTTKAKAPAKGPTATATSSKTKKTKAAAPRATKTKPVPIAPTEELASGAPLSPTAASPEETSLAELYADDMQAPAAAHGEFRDAHTADEDRPLTPEHTAKAVRQAAYKEARDERRDRWKRAREERKARREAKQPAAPGPEAAAPIASRAGGKEPLQRNAPPQPPRARVAMATTPATYDTASPNDRALAAAAEQVFAGMGSPQSVPVRQLSHMMKKRELVAADPERVGDELKWQLIAEERWRRAHGFRASVTYRGRDLFATGPLRLSPTAAQEQALWQAWLAQRAGARAALVAQAGALSSVNFERLAHAMLEAQRFRNITWIKRAAPYAYATAVSPYGDAVLVSARAGRDPIDRRGIGELRVGTEAKELAFGLLISPGTLSADARAELARPGRSVVTHCADAFTDALLNAGLGVTSAHVPVAYLDEGFWADLSST